jgi:hypothetical protein
MTTSALPPLTKIEVSMEEFARTNQGLIHLLQAIDSRALAALFPQ